MSTAAACDNIMLCAAVYGSDEESPKAHFPYGSEQRFGGYFPLT